MSSKIINEGLRPLDLSDLVYPFFEVDTYKSKMGEDKDVCVMSFMVKDRNPAKDLMEFIEKGYGFVLDADVGAGENDKGEYFVFVELKRSPKIAEEIKEITQGVKRLTGIDEWEFRYHKSKKTIAMTEDSLEKIIPSTPNRYELYHRKLKTEDLKSFFNKTLMDDFTLDGNVITIHKPFGKHYKFELIKEDTSDNILEDIQTSPIINDQSMSEIFWLTKVIGDYDINKFGDDFLFTNGDRSILLKRIEQ